MRVEYILICLITISLSTYILYKFFNNILGLGLHYKPLILCAICAIIITITLPVLFANYSGINMTLFFLFASSLFFAYFISRFNHIKLVAKVGQLNSPDILEPQYTESQDEHVCMIENSTACTTQEAVSTAVPVAEIAFVKQVISAKTSDVTEQPAELETSDVTEQPVELETFKIEELKEPAMDTKQIDEYQPKSIIKTFQPPQLETLDDLLDYAYMQKEQRNTSQALITLNRALELYADNDYAPFIIIEMSNILKSKGAYDEAIRIYNKGQSLPVVQKDSHLHQEFVNTIAYLRILKNTLLSHGLSLYPFEQIPLAIRQEIDSEFLYWRLNTK